MQNVLLASVLMKALRGDVRAAEFMRDAAGESPALELKKQELQLRKSELKFKREQAAKQAENAAAQSKMANAWIEALLGEETADDG